MKLFHCRIVSVVLTAAVSFVCVATSQAAPVVLLYDTFNGTSTPDSGNVNYNLSGRQSGSLGAVPYTKSATRGTVPKSVDAARRG